VSPQQNQHRAAVVFVVLALHLLLLKALQPLGLFTFGSSQSSPTACCEGM
jgi:hypothetical protein